MFEDVGLDRHALAPLELPPFASILDYVANVSSATLILLVPRSKQSFQSNFY